MKQNLKNYRHVFCWSFIGDYNDIKWKPVNSIQKVFNQTNVAHLFFLLVNKTFEQFTPNKIKLVHNTL